MRSRVIKDPAPPSQADYDTAETLAAAAAIEQDEWHFQVLGDVAEISLTLTRSLGELAAARIETAKAESRGLSASDEATLTAFNKVAQTLRRTIALRDKLGRQTAKARERLIADRAARRAELDAAHVEKKKTAILYGVHDVYAFGADQGEYIRLIENLMEDVEEHLLDADEFRGWLDRPVGETVARLCAVLGLDPDLCRRDGTAWTAPHNPSELESFLAKMGPAPGWPAPPADRAIAPALPP
jgi:hypothetical protein